MPLKNDEATLRKSMQHNMLASLGVSMETYERWGGSLATAEGDDEKMAKDDRKMSAGANEVTIQGVIVVDEQLEIYQWLFGKDFATSPGMVKAQLAKADGDVLVKIDSYGGHVKAASVICNDLNEYAKDSGKAVNAIVTGWAASAATLVMLQADSVQIAEFGEVMIHRSSVCACGTGIELKKVANRQLKNDGIYASAYAEKSGKTQNEMLKLMDATTWFSASEAVEIGLVDSVAAKRNDDDAEKNSSDDEKMTATDEEFSAAEAKGFDHLSYFLAE